MTCIVDIRDFDGFSLEELWEIEEKVFPSEKAKKSRRESLTGRILLGYLLYSEYGIKDCRLTYGENGKPYLKNENVFFNISHSNNLVMCSVSEKEIGCDIQEIKPYNPRVAKRFYCKSEMELIEKSADCDRAFIRLWTLKESILKKEGTGLEGGLSSYDFSSVLFSDSFSLFGNSFSALSLDGYETAVCGADSENNIVFLEKEALEDYIRKIKVEKT